MSVALWVCPVSNLAGVARHVLDAARSGLPGWSMEVAAPDGPLLDELRKLDVPVHAVEFDGNPAAAVRALRSVIEQVKPQIVHSHLAKADFIAAAATLGLPTKLVSSEHGIAQDSRLYNANAVKAELKLRLHHLRCNRFNALIAVSESTKQQMQRTWKPRTLITVVLNGVDRSPQPHTAPGQRYLSLARLSHEKNILAIVDAFAKLHTGSLTIAGEGPDKAQVQRRVEALGLGDRVSFPGFVDAAKALSEHDVLVQLSKWENASYSILDAVAHGLGVVATPVGGNPEILPERCLVEADDTDRVAALMTEQASPEARPRLPKRWPTVAEMCAQIVDVYDEVWR